uniref:Solute carrier family 25 member 51 n=1 Tax=Angiostrongylus cantonensis TaxID=6313 RepID=A0A0K0DP69_ANGCA
LEAFLSNLKDVSLTVLSLSLHTLRFIKVHNRPTRSELFLTERHHFDFLCGWGAGCIETCILFPSSKVIFRQQLHGFSAKVAYSQLKSEGIGRLYRGLLPPLIMRTSSRALMFGLYDEFQVGYIVNCLVFCCLVDLFYPEMPVFTTEYIVHCVSCPSSISRQAGLCEASLCPLERVQVLLQTSAYHDHFKNTAQALRALKAYGYCEYYRGISVVLARNSLSNAIFFTLKEPFKKMVTELSPSINRTATQLVADFISGAVLGAFISTMFFPVNVVKNHMQSKVGVPYGNPIHVFYEVWRERQKSIRGLYLGVHLNFTRSLLAWGITNTVYELLRRTLQPYESEG